MTEYLIYRNKHLHCIINASTEAEKAATLVLLKDCYPLDKWEMLEKPGKINKLQEVKK